MLLQSADPHAHNLYHELLKLHQTRDFLEETRIEAPIINRFLKKISSVFESLLKQNSVVFLANFFLKNFSKAAQKQCAIINPVCSFVNVPNPSLAQANKQNTLTPRQTR
jgi:hypothetical protein